MNEFSSEHAHPHDGTHARSAASPAETLALLNYLLGHNRSHAQELHDLAHGVADEAARALLHEAVDALQASNDKLEAALKLLKEE